ncbi:MAG: EcsC family protein [Spirochaetota bacterium]
MEKEEEPIQRNILQTSLDWLYDQATQGAANPMSAQSLAKDFQKNGESQEKQVENLIRWQVIHSGGIGFLSGFGGLASLPIALPSSLAATLYVQIRMIAAIATIYGYDLQNDRVRTFVFVSLVGNTAQNILKDISIQLGRKITELAIEKVSASALVKINELVGFKLISKFGEKSIINLSRGVPLVGALVGGGIDAYATYMIGITAQGIFRNEFILSENDPFVTNLSS